jgi:hypothetical protein
MTRKQRSEPFWIDEPDWLCAVEFLNDEDTEGRDLAADTIGYLWGYARLTNTRSLALLGDPSADAYEILFSFPTPQEKTRFLEMVRSNDELGSDYIDTDLLRPTLDENPRGTANRCSAAARIIGPCHISRGNHLQHVFRPQH